MRILLLTHIFSDFLDGGETRIVWELIQALAKSNHKFFVVSTYTDIKDRSKLPKNVKIYQVPFCKQTTNFDPVSMFKAFLFSLPIIFFKKIDIIHLVSQTGPCPLAVFKVRPFVVSTDVPWDYNNPKFREDLIFDHSKKKEEDEITHIKTTFSDKVIGKLVYFFNKFFHLQGNFDKRVDMYICRGIKILNQLKKENYPSKLVHIPSGVNVRFFHSYIKPFKEKDKNNLVFLFAGKISKRKGVEYLIKAFLLLNQKYKNIKLLLVGRGAPSTVAYLKKLTQENPNIIFLGNVSGNQIQHYYTYGDVFILPSLGEPFGLVNLEAMACGKPVISTKGGAVVDYLKNGQVGFIVEPADVNKLSEAMEKFILYPNLIKEMGLKARKHVVKNYSWEQIAKKTLAAYQLLII